jgi:tRNA 2-thiouridine synthesizing protein A
MATDALDLRGLKCPMPTMKVAVHATKLKAGDILEALADCPTFEKDLREWAARAKKTILWIKQEGTAKRTQIKM